MKIKIKRLFRYKESPTKVGELQPGVYDVGRDISEHVAQLALRFGKSEILLEKKAPENKVVEVTENKARVEKTPVRRSRTRSQSDK